MAQEGDGMVGVFVWGGKRKEVGVGQLIVVVYGLFEGGWRVEGGWVWLFWIYVG